MQTCLVLAHTLTLRHGVMVVGAAGSGKTTAIAATAEAVASLPGMSRASCHRLNPKAVANGQLFGEYVAGEWMDGILPSVVREVAPSGRSRSLCPTSLSVAVVRAKRLLCNTKSIGVSVCVLLGTIRIQTYPLPPRSQVCQAREASERAVAAAQAKARAKAKTPVEVEGKGQDWVVIDGPVDSFWIENLNSALDESRALCLASCERIFLPPTLRMVFEAEDLSRASPATVSSPNALFLTAVAVF